ncbi:MAG: caspase family protein [Prevotella sp.]|nr:caspase family protein [Prevotella sp.]
MRQYFKSMLALIFIIMATVSAQAQTFYELSFKAPADNDEYVGLFIYTDEFHCKMRLANSEMVKSNTCYMANYTCHIEDKKDADDVGIMYYESSEEGMPIFIWAWEKEDMSDMSDTPFIAFDVNDTDSWFQAESFQEIHLADMDEEYIAQFYGPNEPEYKMMMSGIEVVKNQNGDEDEAYEVEEEDGEDEDDTEAETDDAFDQIDDVADVDEVDQPEPAPAKGPTMHLVITANTEVSDIGPACEVDLKRAKSEFEGIAKQLGMRLNEQLVSGNNYGRQQVAKAVNALKPGADDVVVFIYSGHGFRFKDQKDFYPCMDLTANSYEDASENYLALSDIFKALSKKGARLCLVLSDCCNSEVDATQPIVANNALFSRSNSNFDLKKMRSLFMKSKGNIIATAAAPGEVSWCGTNGGFFLTSVIESLRNQMSALSKEAPSWNTLIKDAIDQAGKKSEQSQNTTRQNGIKYVKVKSI